MHIYPNAMNPHEEAIEQVCLLTLKVLVATIDAQWEGMGIWM